MYYVLSASSRALTSRIRELNCPGLEDRIDRDNGHWATTHNALSNTPVDEFENTGKR
jgi:hypothetical protein